MHCPLLFPSAWRFEAHSNGHTKDKRDQVYMQNQYLWWLSNGCEEQCYLVVIHPRWGPCHIWREREKERDKDREEESWSQQDDSGAACPPGVWICRAVSTLSPSDLLFSLLNNRNRGTTWIFDQGIILNLSGWRESWHTEKNKFQREK